MSEYHIGVDHDKREVTIHLPVMDIYAGLRQTARIARDEGFKGTAERCEQYADILQSARVLTESMYTDDKGFPALIIRCD